MTVFEVEEFLLTPTL